MIIQVRARTSAGFGDYSSPVDYSGRVRNIGIQYSRCLILHSLMQIHLPLLHQPRVHPHHPVPVKAVLRSHAHLHPPAPHQSLVLWSHVLHLPAPLKVTTCMHTGSARLHTYYDSLPIQLNKLPPLIILLKLRLLHHQLLSQVLNCV